MDNQEFQYECTFKRETTKGIDGFTMTARGNNKDKTFQDAVDLFEAAKVITAPNVIKMES